MADVIELVDSSDDTTQPPRVQPARRAKGRSSLVTTTPVEFAPPIFLKRQKVEKGRGGDGEGRCDGREDPNIPSNIPSNMPASATTPLLSLWKQIEDQLRCDICKSLMDTPVSLKCTHSFCSFCIRRYLELGGNDYCPCCRLPATSTDVKLEPRLAGILRILGLEKGLVRKRIRVAIAGSTSPLQPIGTRNETFTKQAVLADFFSRGGTLVGRSLMPLYKTLKDKQLRELLVEDGLDVPISRDEQVRVHKEFVMICQAAFDALRMGMYPSHPPTKEGLMREFNKTRRRVFQVAESSSSLAELTSLANERMQLQLQQALRRRRAGNSNLGN